MLDDITKPNLTTREAAYYLNRVTALARVAAGLEAGDATPPSPYAQARAIETFLHQYPYTLDLPLPPRRGIE